MLSVYCCCQVASVVSDSVQPHRWQPTRLPRPWDSPGKNPGVGCHFLLQCMKMKSESEFAQLCLTLHDPMDCSPPGSSAHGIFQARVLEWGAIAFSIAVLTNDKFTNSHTSFNLKIPSKVNSFDLILQSQSSFYGVPLHHYSVSLQCIILLRAIFLFIAFELFFLET